MCSKFLFYGTTAQLVHKPSHFEIYRSTIIRHTKTHTHKHPVGRLWTSDWLVAEAATYTTHSKHNRRTSMPSSGFQPAIQKLQT